MGGTVLPSQVQNARATSVVLDPGVATDERAARRTLREQIARLERELADAFVTTFSMGGLPQPAPATASPTHARLLDLGELEVVRDELAERLREARTTISRRADEIAEKRLVLERMLLRPTDYKFVRISCGELGEPGCGVWQVRPRMGLIGMLMGWWQVKLSSGCPLPRGHGAPLTRIVAQTETMWECGHC
ncbi:MAG TPA: hypothetical protein VHW96_18430 [Solirubrobacteraceae bacterium]|jgi:hypothetical protein|nr:hypothetical protein [Solirubrobacteraceae bacterium]